MKLGHVSSEIAIFEIRSQLLNESICEYLGTTIAQLRNDKSIDLEKFAEVITALKVLSNIDHRESLTRDEIGFNPNDARELFSFLNAVNRDITKSEKFVNEIFSEFKNIAPSLFKRTLSELDVLKNGTKIEKQQLIQSLSSFIMKVNQLFNKVKHVST